MVISLLKIPYVHRIYVYTYNCMVLANPKYKASQCQNRVRDLSVRIRGLCEKALHPHLGCNEVKRRKQKNYAGSKNHSRHLLRRQSHFGTGFRKTPPPQRKRKRSIGIRRVGCRMNLKPAPDER
jgi:hypothetical protein